METTEADDEKSNASPNRNPKHEDLSPRVGPAVDQTVQFEGSIVTYAGEDNAGELAVFDKAGKVVGWKRKRGKCDKNRANASMKKTIGENVCFICLDGGDLFLCDHRECPKAYHTSCVKRDEKFFQSKIRWNCGWHLCTVCKKNATYKCYTCTFSLCKGCIKDAGIFCLRGNNGFCDTCMRTVRLIENGDQKAVKLAKIDFDDKSSWEYLFKDYWLDLNRTLLITPDEICQAKNPWKGSKVSLGGRKLHGDLSDNHNDGESKPDSFSKIVEVNSYRRKKAKRWSNVSPTKDTSAGGKMAVSETHKDPSGEREVIMSSFNGSSNWASKELLEFVMHMRNGDKSVRSQFEVRGLLIEYIVKNKLRDPRWKSQIKCDFRLENLFRKPRVLHFEMLNLLDSHFLGKDDSRTCYLQRSSVHTKPNQQGDGSRHTENVLDKAMALQAVRVNDLLKAPKGIQRRAEQVLEIHTNPNMNPSHESEEDEGKADDKRLENNFKPISSGFRGKIMKLVAPQKEAGFSESWGVDSSTVNQDLTKKLPDKSSLEKGNDGYSSNQGRDVEMHSMSRETLNLEPDPLTCGTSSHTLEVSELISCVAPKLLSDLPAAGDALSSIEINELEKQWCYLDPTGKIQGPFSMAQLRTWSENFFPSDLRIWRSTETVEHSILFIDALVGNFHKELSVVDNSALDADTMHGPDHPSIYTGVHGTSLPQPKGARWGGDLGIKSESGFSDVRAAMLIGKSRLSTSGHGNDLFNLSTQTPLSDDEKEETYISASAPSSTSLEPTGSSIKWDGKEDHQNVLNMSQIPDPEEIHYQSIMPFESQEEDTITEPHPSSDSVTLSNPGADMRNAGGSQQNLLITLPAEPPAYGTRGSASSSVINTDSFNPSGSSAVPAITWGPADSSQQTNAQHYMQPNPNLGMGLIDNSGEFPRQGRENLNTNWGQMPGNSNLGWIRPQPENSSMHWGAFSQGYAQEPVNANTSCAPSPQWQPPRNSNPGSDMYKNEQSNQDSFSSNRNWNSHGGDRSYGRGGSWNGQSSFGSGGGHFSRTFRKGRKFCKFHMNGYCRNGSSCNYLHE